MAIVGTPTLLADSQGGSFGLKQSSITVSYHVRVSDPLDGPSLVANAPGIPFLGQGYFAGNDVNPLLTLQTKTPRRVPGSRLLWQVDCSYTSPEGDDGRGPKGKKEKDPRKWHDEIEVNYAQVSRPLSTAEFWGCATVPTARDNPTNALGGVPKGFELLRPGLVTNSAGVVFDPPVERDYSRFQLKLKKFRETFPGAHARDYRDAINNDKFVIKKPDIGFHFVCDKFQARMMNVGGSLKYWDDTETGISWHYWEVEYDIAVDIDQGWLFDIPDLGTGQYGDPIVNLTSDLDTGQVTRTSTVRFNPFIDVASGNPLSEPQKLDGNGKLLEDTNQPGYVIRWNGYPRRPFNKLKL